mmetsp:Transcript_14971/g.34289  ORF Transcript_14971/g.34289 Transcript_14971/m.34289 type:complete len:207 (+) Transcript_14971:2272-2892(+)
MHMQHRLVRGALCNGSDDRVLFRDGRAVDHSDQVARLQSGALRRRARVNREHLVLLHAHARFRLGRQPHAQLEQRRLRHRLAARQLRRRGVRLFRLEDGRAMHQRRWLAHLTPHLQERLIALALSDCLLHREGGVDQLAVDGLDLVASDQPAHLGGRAWVDAKDDVLLIHTEPHLCEFGEVHAERDRAVRREAHVGDLVRQHVSAL